MRLFARHGESKIRLDEHIRQVAWKIGMVSIGQ